MLPQLQSYDDELLKVHLALAAETLPGPGYYTVLRWIHEIVRPATYIEIGIRQGDSLRLALPDTTCVAIDPDPALAECPLPNTRLFATSSDQFFNCHSLTEILGASSFSLAFVDGLHLFEQALRDFINLEKFATPSSIVIIHDCLPLDVITSQRTRTTHFYSGDVWKVAMCLNTSRPDLKMKTIRTGPTGLCLIGNLDRHSSVLATGYDDYVAEYIDLTFDDYKRRTADMPATVENTLDAVSSCIADLLNDTCGSNPCAEASETWRQDDV